MTGTFPHLPAVVVGDIGSTTAFHIGDEAMLECLVAADGDGAWTAISRDPAATAARLGIPAVAGPAFPPGHAGPQREEWLVDILGAGGADDDRAAAAVRALDGARGLLVAGGGNLSSSWPEHLYARVALIALARRRGLPVVVSGQTLGPRLTGRERELLGWALRQAALVGVRERASHRLALELGVPPERLVLQVDDAMFLGAGDDEPAVAPYVAVTVCALGEPAAQARLLAGLAQGLAVVHQRTATPFLLIPHLGARGGPPTGDVRIVHDLLRRLRALDVPASTPGLLEPTQAAALTRRASLIISTRYHPLVFGMSGAVPSLAVTLDDYTSTKMRGVLELAGLQSWSLPVEAAAAGLLAPAATELWERRAQVAAHLHELLPHWRRCAATHTARVLGTLDGRAVPSEEPHPVATAPVAAGEWTVGAHALDVFRSATAHDRRARDDEVRALRESFAEAERYALSLREAFDVSLRHARALQHALDGTSPAPASPPPAVNGRGRPQVVLTDLRHDQVGVDVEASMRVRRAGTDLGRLVLRRHVATRDEIDRSGTPFVALAAMLAGVQNHDVRIDAPVDGTAADNARAAARLLRQWFGWHHPTITTAGRTEPVGAATGTGLCFSRGLDSMTSLTLHRNELDLLIGMDWRDPPFATDGTAAIWQHTLEAAAESGLPFVGVSTNARSFLDPVVAWDVSHGVVLAALSQLVAPAVGEVLVSGTHASGYEEPHGSHPHLVPLWTSSRVALTYAPGPGARHRKAGITAGDPFAMRWLKVCWERPGEGNCGRCTKCLLTMTEFAIAGRLDAVRPRFEGELTPEAVRATTGYDTPANVRSTLDALAHDDPLRAAWQAVYERVAQADAERQQGMAAVAFGP